MAYKPGDKVRLKKDRWVIQSTIMGLRLRFNTQCTVLGFERSVVGSPPLIIIEVLISETVYIVITVKESEIY